jgi:shikimate kinase
MNNVFLTGFMGTGKSCVGRALAERLGTGKSVDGIVLQILAWLKKEA